MLGDFANGRKTGHVEIDPTNASFHDMETVAYMFYKQLDAQFGTKFYETLKNSFSSGKVKLNAHEPNERGGRNCVGQDFDANGKPISDCIVELSPPKTMAGYIVVAHEFSHVLEERTQKMMKQKSDCLSEVVSMYVEKIFIDFLSKLEVEGKGTEKQKFIDENQKQQFLKHRDNLFLKQVCIMLEENEIIEQLGAQITGEKLEAIEKKYEGSQRGKALSDRMKVMIFGDCGHEVYGQREFRYVVGEVVSRALYQDFQKNPQKTMNKFSKFLKVNAEIDEKQAFSLLLGENYQQKVQDVLCDGKLKL